MAHSRTARKRMRQNEKRRAVNRWRLKSMREAMKAFGDKIAHGSLDEAREALKACQKVIDRTAQKGVIHKNQAARRKSRLTARFKAKETGKAPAKA